MKRQFGHMFLGVCIVVAALIFTHPPKREMHHYEWSIGVPGRTGLAMLDTDTGDVFVLSANRTSWEALPAIPRRQSAAGFLDAAPPASSSKGN